MKESIRGKCTQYMERAEQLQIFLKKKNHQSASKEARRLVSYVLCHLSLVWSETHHSTSTQFILVLCSKKFISVLYWSYVVHNLYCSCVVHNIYYSYGDL